jgi:hypothetical protein
VIRARPRPLLELPEPGYELRFKKVRVKWRGGDDVAADPVFEEMRARRLGQLMEPARARVYTPPDFFGDESFGSKTSFLTPAVFALLPRDLDYGWLHDLRARASPAVTAMGAPLKWDDLLQAMEASPSGAIAVGARRALTRAQLSVVDYEEFRSRERPYASLRDVDRWQADKAALDAIVLTDPLSGFVGIDVDDMRSALQLPERLPSPSDPRFRLRMIEGVLLGADRPERQKNLMPYALRAAASAIDVLDREATGNALDGLLRSGHRYALGDKLRSSLTSKLLTPRRSFEQGHTRSTSVVNAVLDTAAQDLDDMDLALEDVAGDRQPLEGYQIVEHDPRDYLEGQAADMAAGWARQIYKQERAVASTETAIRALCATFSTVIFNNKLYQRQR